MKQDIHPELKETRVVCSCGNTFTTRTVKDQLHVELCNQCHPFYTGKQKLVDTGGRVERFQKKYAKRARRSAEPAEAEAGTENATSDAPTADAAPEETPAAE